MMRDYELVVGIETHVQLSTKTKLFCGCDNDAREAAPNTKICPVCLGLPGALPVLNAEAVRLALRAGLALNAEATLVKKTKFDRKNYFYPDLPSGYQITQFDQPIVGLGHVDVPMGDTPFRVGITRAHMEADAGKLTHPEGADYSLVDYNRASTPLLEIVSEPDITSAAQAKAYATELHNLMRYAGVSDANLYYGNMRFDVNVSVRKVGAKALGTRTETKNLNSFKAIEKTVDYEYARQVEVLEGGGTIVQETRGWDDTKQITYSQRTKEDAMDYRYFPEPDLPPIVINQHMVDAAMGEIEYLPQDIRQAAAAADLPPREVEVLIAEPTLAALWYQINIENPKQSKFAFNWLIGDQIKLAESRGQTIAESDISSLTIGMVGSLVAEGKLSSTNAKVLLAHLWDKDGGAMAVAEKLGLLQQSDAGAIEAIVDGVIAAHLEPVTQYRAGEIKVMGFLVGQVMKASKGQANPGLAGEVLKRKLEVSDE